MNSYSATKVTSVRTRRKIRALPNAETRSRERKAGTVTKTVRRTPGDGSVLRADGSKGEPDEETSRVTTLRARVRVSCQSSGTANAQDPLHQIA